MGISFTQLVSDVASTYGRDTIFILGKGPSADKVPSRVYNGSLVVGVNDAERIQPAAITIFHAEWVQRALSASGPKAELYLTSTDFSPANSRAFVAPHIQLGQDGSDLMMQRLLSGDFVIEDVLFISALKVALEVARERGRVLKVYMIGFDFDAEAGYANIDGDRYELADMQNRRLVIGMQESFLLNALYMLRGSEIDVVHVGYRNYSAVTPEDLTRDFSPTAVKYGSSDWKVSVVAEITTNHFGDRARLEKMVRAAKVAGADFVKVQKRDVESFYTQEQLKSPYKSPFGSTFGDYRRQLELSYEDFNFLKTLCDRIGINWFASVLDLKSYAFVMDFNPVLIKLPSTISEHTEYLESVANIADRGVVLSTGMTDGAFENWILDKFNKVPQLILMQANSAYPTPASDCNIAVVSHYQNLARQFSHLTPGYSSHDEGWFGSVLAIAAGARMVEKHVKLGNTDWAHFDAVALDLTTPAFGEYVAKLREAEIALGSEVKAIAPSENHKYKR